MRDAVKVSLKNLSTDLGIDREIILSTAETVSHYYSSFDNLKYRRHNSVAWRHIDNPTGVLKLIQTRIQRRILRPYVEGGNVPEYVVGGMPGRSINRNADPHSSRPCVVGLDLKKCFDHINEERILDVYLNCLGFGRAAAAVATKLTTFQGRLPQGSSSSTILCALALRNMSKEINDYCITHSLSFTMYVDDITISGDYKNATLAIEEIIRICTRHNMHVNRSKTEIMKSNRPQLVTGYLVNTRVGINNKYTNTIRKEIIRVSQKGYAPSNRELFQIWEKIKYVRRYDISKAQRLYAFASGRLQDVEGLIRDVPSPEHRPCKSYSSPHTVNTARA